eukprot:1536835-Rhodomonas_salina.1
MAPDSTRSFRRRSPKDEGVILAGSSIAGVSIGHGVAGTRRRIRGIFRSLVGTRRILGGPRRAVRDCVGA